MSGERWRISKEEQKRYIDALVKELAPLRARLGISQGELAYLIGVSRQTYSAVELQKKQMTWSTYLSLIMVFDSVSETREVLRLLDAYPSELIKRFNDGDGLDDRKASLMSDDFWSLVSELDDHAIHALRTTVLVEYARCKGVSGNEVVRSFDGIDFRTVFSEKENLDLDNAIKNYKG